MKMEMMPSNIAGITSRTAPERQTSAVADFLTIRPGFRMRIDRLVVLTHHAKMASPNERTISVSQDGRTQDRPVIPSPPARKNLHRLGWLLLILVMSGLLTAELFFKGFTSFNLIDDQGYVMMTLKQYREGHPLYNGVFTQYGPGYYVLRTWLYCGTKITHDRTGLVSLLHALVCCLGLGWITYRVT